MSAHGALRREPGPMICWCCLLRGRTDAAVSKEMCQLIEMVAELYQFRVDLHERETEFAAEVVASNRAGREHLARFEKGVFSLHRRQQHGDDLPSNAAWIPGNFGADDFVCEVQFALEHTQADMLVEEHH